MKRPFRIAAVLLTTVLAGCGTTTVKTVTERETVSKAASTVARTSSKASSGSSASATRAAKAKRRAARARAAGGWTACDSNITALRPHTSCGFAQNAFYGYWVGEGASHIDVWSPSTKRSYSTSCVRGTSRVTCSTSDGGRVRFSTSALQAYSESQAVAYVASHDVGPDVGGPAEDVGGTADPEYDEPDYDEGDSSGGDEIPNYDNGTGYRVQCADGMYSKSGGRPGACSGHGGVG